MNVLNGHSRYNLKVAAQPVVQICAEVPRQHCQRRAERALLYDTVRCTVYSVLHDARHATFKYQALKEGLEIELQVTALRQVAEGLHLGSLAGQQDSHG